MMVDRSHFLESSRMFGVSTLPLRSGWETKFVV